MDAVDPFSAFRLDGRSAVVTGGGSGIGRAIAQTLAAAGAAVTVGDINEATGEETVERIAKDGGRAIFHRTDVTVREELDGLAAAAVGTFGGLHIQCNIAGIPSVQKELLDQYGYRFELNASGDQYEATATPIEYGKTGRRSFFVDQSAVLRGDDHGGAPAGASDNPVQGP